MTTTPSVSDRFTWGLDLHDSAILAVVHDPVRSEMRFTLDMAAVVSEPTPGSVSQFDPTALYDAAELTFTGVVTSSEIDEDTCSDSWMVSGWSAPVVDGMVHFTLDLMTTIGAQRIPWGTLVIIARDFRLEQATWRAFREGDDPRQAVALMETPDTPGSRRALKALARRVMLPGVAEALADASTSDAVRIAITKLLQQSGWREAVPVLAPLLDSPNPRVRACAAEALGKLRDSSVGSRLLQLFSNPREQMSVRVEAALALGEVRYAPAADALRSGLRGESFRLRSAAAKALARIEGRTG